MLYVFCQTAQQTQTLILNLLHSIYYLLHVHVSATGYGHFEGAMNFHRSIRHTFQVVLHKW